MRLKRHSNRHKRIRERARDMAREHEISRERQWVQIGNRHKKGTFCLLCAGERRIENRLKRLVRQGYSEAKACMIVEGEILDAKQEQRERQPV